MKIELELKEIMAHIMLIENVVCIKSGMSNDEINGALEKIRKYIDKTITRQKMLKNSDMNKGE